jgi:AcrR family transcriptional regulator
VGGVPDERELPDDARPATRTRTRLAREERREQIVDAAAEVFHGRNPADVTFEEIADAAGVSRALVYNYFGDRDGVLEAVYRRNLHELRQRIGSVLVKSRGRAALRELVRVNVEYAIENPAGYRYAAGDGIFDRIPDLERRRIDSVATNLGGDADAHLVAMGWLSAIHGMVIYWIDHPAGISSDRAIELITSFLGGALSAVSKQGLPILRPPGAPRPAAEPELAPAPEPTAGSAP